MDFFVNCSNAQRVVVTIMITTTMAKITVQIPQTRIFFFEKQQQHKNSHSFSISFSIVSARMQKTDLDKSSSCSFFVHLPAPGAAVTPGAFVVADVFRVTK